MAPVTDASSLQHDRYFKGHLFFYFYYTDELNWIKFEEILMDQWGLI